MKTCSKCKLEKPKTEFRSRPERPCGLQSRCRSCECESERTRYAENPEVRAEQKAYNAAQYAKNCVRFRAEKKEYYAANCEKIKDTARKNHVEFNRYKRRYLSENPSAKVASNMRTRIYIALSGAAKSSGTFDLVGCNKSELCLHLEKQFRTGMTWENYGPVWHVDHIKPCVRFNLADPEQQRVCFHYSNLQPLFAEENLRKSKS